MENRKLSIAVCKNRKDKKYHNQKVAWSDLVKKLETTTYTHETLNEYRAMSKDRQSDIKDVGGFVGGYLKDGKRGKETVVSRSMITLDLDDASMDIVDDWDMLGSPGYAMVVYSTHKHTLSKPKLRLILPLSRDVDADEYEFIARTVAQQMDSSMLMFDDTTYQPSRMMFWPSTSKDGDYLYRVYDDAWLDVDAMLSQHPDWQDMSTWPYSERTKEVIKRPSKKQEDPTKKKGIVGAFCKAYTVQEAISKFIPEVYIPTDKDDRWTYAEGSTAGGLVIYEDGRLAYSNHSTDPASDFHSHNAFDLIRIHKFGELDEGVSNKVTAGNMPSFKALSNLLKDDEETKLVLGQEAIAEAWKDFEEDLDEDDGEWQKELEVDTKGNFVSSINNAKLIMQHDPKLKNSIGGYDQFNQKAVRFGDLPWRKYNLAEPGWDDVDDAGLSLHMEKVYNLNLSNDKMRKALALVHEENAFNPVRDYLDSLEWDGVPRLDTILIDYLGVHDELYVRAVARKAFTAAVARIYTPGCKMDYILTLAGPQGVGKSYLLKVMGGQWFSDSIVTMSGKEAYEALHGSWVIEIAELAASKKTDIEAMKQFISKQSDRYRKAYGTNVKDYPRQCVFFGTTNDYEFLRDYTGNRRFWPVRVREQDPTKSVFDDLPKERDQIWAEAKYRYEHGEPLYLEGELAQRALEVQDEFTFRSSKEEDIANYLDTLLPENWYEMSAADRCAWLENDEEKNTGTMQRDRVSGIEIWVEVFRGLKRNFTTVEQREITSIMKHLGWEKAKNPVWIDHNEYKRQKAFIRPGKWTPLTTH